MATTVINIRNAPKGWEKDPRYVYIGRAGRGQSGKWGNPHPIGYCLICSRRHNRDESIAEFAQDFNTGEGYDMHEIKDKILVCFCKPLECHGDILAWACNGS